MLSAISTDRAKKVTGFRPLLYAFVSMTVSECFTYCNTIALRLVPLGATGALPRFRLFA